MFGGTAGVPIPYIEACLKVGGAEYFDVMNIHPYMERGLPEKMKDLIDPLFALFRKRVPAKYEGYVHMVGMAGLLALSLVVTFSDIGKLFGI